MPKQESLDQPVCTWREWTVVPSDSSSSVESSSWRSVGKKGRSMMGKQTPLESPQTHHIVMGMQWSEGFYELATSYTA